MVIVSWHCYLQCCNEVLQEAVYFLNKLLIYGAVSFISRIHSFRYQVVKMGMTPFLLPVPVFLCFAGLEALVLEEEMLLPGDKTTIPLNEV